MKKSFIWMLAALAGVTMVSCSSDDDGPSAGPTVGITAVQVPLLVVQNLMPA